jgi:transcriptional regulator with XRE-family HTH domain
MKLKSSGPKPVDIEVGRRVKARRLAIGMSQERLASILGVTYQQVQKYERGTNRIGSSRLAEIAKALAVPVAALFEDQPEPAAAGTAAPASGLAEDRQPFVVDLPRLDPATTPRDVADLLVAFARVTDPVLRRRIIDLIQAIADQH